MVMKKIISLFQRNYETDKLVRNEVVPGAEWVLNGEGVATRKFDGTCCMLRDGKLYKRYEVKPGGKPPENFEPANDVDANTGKQQGWLPVGDGPEDQWHREAYETMRSFIESSPPFSNNGTFELVGPKVQGNPEKFNKHMLVSHFTEDRQFDFEGDQPPRDFDGLRTWLGSHECEGIVWHHPDGRMVKIKRKDFFKRGDA
ncbi:MAG: DUF5565 family protein [Pirellulales bacterium]